MSSCRCQAMVRLAVLLAIVSVAAAQENSPRIGYVFPAGGRSGETFDIAVGGRYLEGPIAVLISGGGVQPTIVAHIRPGSSREVGTLKSRLRDLERKKADAAKEAIRVARQIEADKLKAEEEKKKAELEKQKQAALEKQYKADLEKWKQAEAEKQKAAARAKKPPPPRTPPPAPPKIPTPSRPKAAPTPRPKVVWTSQDDKAMVELQKRIAYSQIKPSSPTIAETVVVTVALAADAAPGQRELRLVTRTGVSNAFSFFVGELPEVREKEAGSNLPPPVRRDPKAPLVPATLPAPADITLPAIVNGQIMPGEVDRYRCKASKGERLVVAVSAQALVPYIPDAVPGWFQAAVAIGDAKGKELAFADDYRFHPDPVLYYEVPRDDEYIIEIKDALYRGREDFVYRMTVGEVPFVTSIFPLGGRLGVPASVEVKGWNLPADRAAPPTTQPGVGRLSVRSAQAASNQLPFAVDALPECLEKEPNDEPRSAQTVVLPVIVNGRIDRPGDRDVFRFDGRAGEQIVAEVCARRLDSPLDSVLRLTDAAGRQLAFNDDYTDAGAALTTHHADSFLTATLPANGIYYVHLGDVQRKGGPEYAYRLRLGAPRPDFELRAVPSSITVRGGGTVPLTVHALRRDGFAGDIELALQGAPAGCTLSGGRVPANQDRARLTLTVPAMQLKEPVSLCLEGRAMIQGRETIRTAIAADDMMQAFSYRHLVPAGELKLAVVQSSTPAPAIRVVGTMPVGIPVGGTASLQVALPTITPEDKVEFQLSEPPEGIAIRSAAVTAEGMVIVLQSDAAKVKPGLKGNLLITAVAERTIPPTTQTARPIKRRTALGMLPAIPFEVAAP